LHGDQVNALLGLTRRISPNLLIGVLGGYETFDYRSDALVGRLKGEGWTVGSYLGWKLTSGLRLDLAAAYSGISYNGVAGAATGTFDGNRLLLSGGLIGSYRASVFQIEPSAKIYALRERENAYTDSLGTLQGERTFTTGRASGGVKFIYPITWKPSVAVAPYAGFYADYYFTADDAAAMLAGALPLASQPLLDGWSARTTFGLVATFQNGVAGSFGGEYSGIGGNAQIWTFRGRASVPF
jgi:outer membrane autotransporter protein